MPVLAMIMSSEHSETCIFPIFRSKCITPYNKKAVSIFDGKVPGDRDDRDDVISNNEEFEASLDECDQAFFEYEEDLDALNYAYVMKNRELFS